jgi:hypothetical protein
MAIDPNISLGVRGIELPNQLAQYAQVAQIQSAQNQNQLAQYQLGAAQRADVAAEGLNRLYAKHYDPVKGTVDQNALMAEAATTPGLASQIPKLQELATKRELEAATLGETKSKTSERDFKLANDRLKHGWESMGDASTPQAAIEKLNDGVKNGYFTADQAAVERQKLEKITTPEEYKDYRVKKIMGLLAVKDQLEQTKVTTKDTDRGGYIERQTYNAQGMPVGKPTQLPKTATIGEQTAQGQLGLAKQKFAWEQANPGFELKEAEDGSIVGVNKRTLQAFPVTVGGAAPAAAPMAQSGVPGARLPATTTVPAIPGMTSVLDQQVPATAPVVSAVGTPLMGKAQNLTESQSNATAYGMRMKEANAILDTMAKQGTLRGANIEAVPFVGEGLGKVLPSVLGGTSAAQQQVNQAKSNFITAVLRKESGAVISDSEFDREDKKYFPQVNDSSAVIKQKENARKLAMKALDIQAGPGAKNIQQLQPSSGGGVDLSNPLLK